MKPKTRKEGDQMKERKIAATMIRIPATLHYGLRRLALDERTTFNALASEALKEFFNKRTGEQRRPEKSER
jgi:hypothetical protein